MPEATSISKSPRGTAYDFLLGLLRHGDFGPGDRLREKAVAGRLGLSSTPVRKALRRLEREGIFELRRRVGVVVRVLAQREVVECYEMRFMLE